MTTAGLLNMFRSSTLLQMKTFKNSLENELIIGSMFKIGITVFSHCGHIGLVYKRVM